MTFTKDWSKARSYWPALFRDLAGKPGLQFLEIGCFEGMATLWLLENVLTGDGSHIDVVDTFSGSPDMFNDSDWNSRAAFNENTAEHRDKVTVYQGLSSIVLRVLPYEPTYDFIYVDGSHLATDVLSDAVLSWPLLKPGGLMAFDDYAWGEGMEESLRPKPSIDAFLAVNKPFLSVIGMGSQVVVRKNEVRTVIHLREDENEDCFNV